MKTYVDNQKLLNIHPLVCYVLFKEEEQVRKTAFEEVLQQRLCLIGAYQIEAVTKSKINESLPQELQQAISENSILVKLLDKGDAYSYALGNIPPNDDPQFKWSIRTIKALLSEVTKYNNKVLDELINESDGDTKHNLSEFKAGYCNLMGNSQTTTQIVRPTRYSIRPTANHSLQLTSFCTKDDQDEYEKYYQIYRDNPNSAELSVPKLMALLAKSMELPNKEETKELVLRYVDVKNHKKVSTFYDRNTRSEGQHQIEIKLVSDQKKTYRLIFIVDGQELTFRPSDAQARLLYAFTLLKKTQGKKFIYNDLKIAAYHQNNSAEYEWLKKHYNLLGETKEFEEWYKDLKGSNLDYHPIHQGISACNNSIRKELETHNLIDAYSQLELTKYDNEQYFDINVPDSCISIDKQFL